MSGLRYDDTLGAAFIGFTCAAVLYGVLVIQIYIYFQRYKFDRGVYKFFVIAVWVLETAHSALTGHAVYHYAITNFDNPAALLIPTWTVIIQVLAGAIISVLVKSAFTMRVWRFSNKNIYLFSLIMLMNLAVLALAVVFCYKAFHLETFLHLPDLKWVTTTVLTISVAADIVIAAALTYYLHHLRRSVFAAKTLVNALIKYSIETGAVTSLCGIACLVAFDVWPSAFIYMSFYFVQSKLYSNSLLATLNTRKVIRGRGTDRGPVPIGEFTIIHTAGQIHSTPSRFGQFDYQKRPPDLEVNVVKETICIPGRGDPRNSVRAVSPGDNSACADGSQEQYYRHSYRSPVSSPSEQTYEYGTPNGYLRGVHRITTSTTVTAEEPLNGNGNYETNSPQTPLPDYLHAVTSLRDPEPALRR